MLDAIIFMLNNPVYEEQYLTEPENKKDKQDETASIPGKVKQKNKQEVLKFPPIG